MLFNGLNDYELIYLIGENNDVALNLMYEKYSIYIYKIIYEYNINSRFKEEFFQEGLMQLNVALKTFKTKYNKTFFKYFDLILRREFNRLSTKSRKYDIPIDNLTISSMLEDSIVEYKTEISLSNIEKLLNKEEKIIFEEVYIKNRKSALVSKEYNINIKKVYNIIQKIKKIIRKENDV